MIAFIHTFTKTYFDRTKRGAFDKIRQITEQKKIQIGFLLVKRARMRQRSALGSWISNI